VLRSNSIALILDFVASGRGASFLNWLDVAPGVARGELRFAPLASRRLTDRLYLVTATNAPPSPGAACSSIHGYVYYFKYSSRSTRWTAVSVSPASRMQNWFLSGSSWGN